MQLQRNPVIADKLGPDRTVKAILADLEAKPDDFFPPTEMMKVIGSPDKTHFLLVMAQLFTDLYHTGDFGPDSSILDLGCGCGRMALPFLGLLGEGRYHGLDVWAEGIAWCRKHITARNAGFRFTHIEADDNYYFDERTDRPNHFTLPDTAEHSVDFAFAVSVFTHLNRSDSEAYLGEFRRTLRPGGRAYLTAFIIDDEFFRYVEETGNHTAVKEAGDGFYEAYSKQHYLCGYTLPRWAAMVEGAGLRVLSYDPGSWARKTGALRYQDTFVVESP